jgi:hypothetical protein
MAVRASDTVGELVDGLWEDGTRRKVFVARTGLGEHAEQKVAQPVRLDDGAMVVQVRAHPTDRVVDRHDAKRASAGEQRDAALTEGVPQVPARCERARQV